MDVNRYIKAVLEKNSDEMFNFSSYDWARKPNILSLDDFESVKCSHMLADIEMLKFFRCGGIVRFRSAITQSWVDKVSNFAWVDKYDSNLYFSSDSVLKSIFFKDRDFKFSNFDKMTEFTDLKVADDEISLHIINLLLNKLSFCNLWPVFYCFDSSVISYTLLNLTLNSCKLCAHKISFTNLSSSFSIWMSKIYKWSGY